MLDSDSEHFDCETCELARAQETLDRDNQEAWLVYVRCRERLVVESGLTAEVFRRLVEGWPTSDVLEVVERLGVIHDVISPRQKQES